MDNKSLEEQLSRLGIDLNNLEVVSYNCFTDSESFDVIMISGGKKIIVSLKKVVKVEFTSKQILSKITSEISNDKFFTSALESICKDKRLITGNCLFCFYGSEDDPFLKIVARSYSISVN